MIEIVNPVTTPSQLAGLVLAIIVFIISVVVEFGEFN